MNTTDWVYEERRYSADQVLELFESECVLLKQHIGIALARAEIYMIVMQNLIAREWFDIPFKNTPLVVASLTFSILKSCRL